MDVNFPIRLLDALVRLDEHVILLEKASSENPDENEQSVIVRDMMQQAGVVNAEFRAVWAVYDEPEEAKEVENESVQSSSD